MTCIGLSSGRGNNWAFGFFDEDGIQEIMESFRKIVEANYKYEGALILHSLAGGTGSGLGSRYLTKLIWKARFGN